MALALEDRREKKKITLLHQKAIFHKYRRGREEGEREYTRGTFQNKNITI